ncbi:hypothetical protein BKA67DRAFT_576630 [Truncatella angustata]|uniref:BZIP domain-containing protein n=1 Tax=Truncatella angustata TaxID=152316 RepID=A0A9P8ZVT7_9PEZI|nr:uncharacterized protein BKA67DRAFT_576630 [Truncatella angustata]KAH6649044.1 hypothetical protein BKA67DRAFT_576630 [Truncatella angustata]KAH8201791.1 hypothetical protein TruAng_004055 [Truncatella angustata]
MVESGDARPTGQSTTSQRKRERDKLNQRNKRQREREHIAALEEKIRSLEQELRNATLCQQSSTETEDQGQLTYLDAATRPPGDITSGQLQSWRTLTGTISINSSPAIPVAALSDTNQSTETSVAQSTVTDRSSSPGLVVTLSLEPLGKLLATPDWLRLPLLTFSTLSAPRVLLPNERFGSVIEHLRCTPNVAMLLPVKPKVLDMLFGGSRNELANLIVSALAPYPVLPPEKFAIGWLMYLYFRWYIAPSQQAYLAIPKHMRPTPCQLFLEHPVYIIALLWPSLRDRLVLHWRKYNLENVFGLLSCTIRVRASFNGNFVTRENDGEPQVDETFYRRFMQEDGWGVLDRFWTEYPELVEGLDYNFRIGEEHLLPT